MKAYTSRETVGKTIRKLLKKAKKGDLIEKIIAIIEEQIRRLPDVDFGELAKKIDGIILE